MWGVWSRVGVLSGGRVGGVLRGVGRAVGCLGDDLVVLFGRARSIG